MFLKLIKKELLPFCRGTSFDAYLPSFWSSLHHSMGPQFLESTAEMSPSICFPFPKALKPQYEKIAMHHRHSLTARPSAPNLLFLQKHVSLLATFPPAYSYTFKPKGYSSFIAAFFLRKRWPDRQTSLHISRWRLGVNGPFFLTLGCLLSSCFCTNTHSM